MGVDFRELQSVRRVGVDELPIVPPKCRIGYSRLLGKPREVDTASQCRRDVSVLCRVEVADADADRPLSRAKDFAKAPAGRWARLVCS